MIDKIDLEMLARKLSFCQISLTAMTISACVVVALPACGLPLDRTDAATIIPTRLAEPSKMTVDNTIPGCNILDVRLGFTKVVGSAGCRSG